MHRFSLFATIAFVLIAGIASGFRQADAQDTPTSPASLDAAAAPVELVWRIEQPWGIPSVDPRTGNVWIPADFGSYTIVSPDGQVLESWGTRGDAEGQFDFSVGGGLGKYGGSVFDPAGNLYVVDAGNWRIQKFGPDRSFITSWGEQGFADGQFQLPREIAIDAQGRLYVTDEDRNDVQVFNGDGNFLYSFGEGGVGDGQFDDPAGVAIDRDGNVWIGDWGNHRIQKFNPEGLHLGTFGRTGPGELALGYVFGVTTDAAGYVYVADATGNRVQVFDTVGNWVAVWDQVAGDDFDGLSELVVDGQGNLYVSDGDNLRKIRPLLPPLPPTSELTPPSAAATPAAQAPAGAVLASAEFPITPDPAMCLVDPRPIADFEALVAAPDSAPATPEDSAGSFTPPAGDPADTETTALVAEAAVELFACYAAGDWLRASALWTDDYLASEDAAFPYTEDDIAFLAASPVPDEPDLRLTLSALRETVVLPDGRVGSFLDVQYPDGSAETQYGIVELVDGRYRLDEVAFAGPLPGTPTP